MKVICSGCSVSTQTVPRVLFLSVTVVSHSCLALIYGLVLWLNEDATTKNKILLYSESTKLDSSQKLFLKVFLGYSFCLVIYYHVIFML